jgi:pyruvate dehydrogenase E2 component (dihydrolipoyllysine-residue acetyltransferase)
MYDFKFADVGEGIHEGVILKWNFKQGDKVKEGETLVVVETDKVNAELPSPVDGVISKLGAQEGDTIHVGETVVIIDDGSSAAKEEKTEVKEVEAETKKNFNFRKRRR